MDKNELLKYLICEIDLVMHDKDYRFENEDGTWYSRESCKNLTNEEVFEELKGELRQLAKIEDDFADLEAKLAESKEQLIAMNEKSNKIKKESYYLKQQLAEKDQAIESLQEINQSLGQTCNNDAKEIERLREQLAEKDAEIKQLKFQIAVDEDWAITNRTRLTELEDELSELKFRERTNQNKTAIEELEKVKDFIIKNNEPTKKMTTITRFINQKINDLRGK